MPYHIMQTMKYLTNASFLGFMTREDETRAVFGE